MRDRLYNKFSQLGSSIPTRVARAVNVLMDPFLNSRYPKLFKVRALWICLCMLISNLFFISISYADDRVSTFLQSQKTIRIFIDGGPGLGDQASTVNAMHHLHENGFRGTFEVIYGNVTLNKVITVFDLPTEIKDKDVYEYENSELGKIKFFKIKPYWQSIQNNEIELVDLGLSVGALTPSSSMCDVARQDGLTLNADSQVCANYANFIHTKFFIQFDPFNGLPERTTEIYKFGESDYIHQEGSGNKYLITPAPSLRRVKSFLTEEPVGIATTMANPALNTFIEGMENQRFNVLPVYGHYFTGQESYLTSDFVSNILQVITGARYAQLNIGNSSNLKPLIIAIFYDYDKESILLKNIITDNNWNNYDKNPQVAEQIKIASSIIKSPDLGKLSDDFKIASIHDETTRDIINQLQQGQILLLSMGMLPKTVFDGLYTYSGENMWLSIYEGAGTENLLSSTGRPAVMCDGTSALSGTDVLAMVMPGVVDKSLTSELIQFYDHFCHGIQTWSGEGDIYKMLGDLILQARDPKSTFSQYYKNRKENMLEPENNRIHYALEEIVKIINE